MTAGTFQRTGGLSALKDVVVDSPAGSWFVIHDCVTELTAEDKPHRWILPRPTANEPVVPAFVRSTSPYARGMQHRRHNTDHSPRCKIDEDGRIGGQKTGRGVPPMPFPLKARWLTMGRYSCHEPDERVVAEVQRMERTYATYRASLPARP